MTRMSGLRYPRHWLLLAACVAVTALAVPSASLAASHSAAARPGTSAAHPGTSAAHPASGTSSYQGSAFGNLDCNGHSPIQHPIKVGGYICTEVHGGTHNGHLEDNGYYIGHDEPTVQFYSNKPGSSNNVSYVQTLPRDPSAAPTVHGPLKDTTHFFELMPALWYAMALCDPNSYPLLPCQPDSDSNSPHGNYPGGGSAFLELQFYPPGFAPFADALSCDNAHWCAALTIDSLECQAGFAVCNNNCVEPVNAAFIQTNGVPTGPPSPQKANLNTVTPNQRTLLMNPGDKLDIHIFDSKGAGALETQVRDLSTGQTGFMLASAKNGFMNTSIADCSGTPFNFRPEYSTASTINQGGWAAANINVAYEVGHFTPCTKLKVFAPIDVHGHLDKSWNFCTGPYENAGPPDSPGSGETNDAPCFPAGDTHGSLNADPNLVTGCTGGDLDYDGTSYWRNWPSSTTPNMWPSALTITPPTTGGAGYSKMQFLTDNPATNVKCNPQTGAGCVIPPAQAPGKFYPYWTLAKVNGTCAWEFGQMTNGKTFGGDKQYGTFTTALGLAELASKIMPNPHC
jgi:hypothetical protein